MAPKQPFIRGFTRVAPTAWEYIPDDTFSDASTIDSSTSDHPELILLFSWTGANGRHVSKYTTTYQTLFPATPILVIRTSIKDLCYRSSTKKQQNLQPTLTHLAHTHGRLSNILVHCFSEGGSNKAVEFAEAYHTRFAERLPVMATCLDSTPGQPRYRNLCAAFQKTLPSNPVFRCTGLVLGGIVLGGLWLVYSSLGRKEQNVISKTRRRIEDERYWDLTRPRAYFYSKSDALIDWRDVREHAIAAAYKGVQVHEVSFERSGHCNHVSEDAERYWEAVRAAWKGAVLDEKMKIF